MRFRFLSLIAIVVLASASPVLAITQTYFGEDLGLGENTRLPSWPSATAAQTSFLSSLVGVGVESFESFLPGATAPLAVSFGAAGTATLMGNGFVDNVPPPGTNGYGRYPTTGNQYWESSDIFSLSFSNPIAAFGFFGVDIGDFGGQVTLTAVGGSTITYTIPSTINGPGGSVLFWGVIDTTNPFTQATFGNTAPGTDFFGFDDFTIGTVEQVVPEPATLALLGIGLLGFGVLSRRRAR